MATTVFITGGTGFVGSYLVQVLLKRGYRVIAASRSARASDSSKGNLRFVTADTTVPGSWQNELKEVDVVINLAGVSIFHYWTKSYKKSIYDSRILTTQNLVDALPTDREVVLCSTSALGFYGTRGDEVLNETEPVGDDFLAKVCQDWENEAFKAAEKNCRVVTMRFSTVVDKSGGAMKIMIPPYRFMVGGPMGSGKQWFPWIHLSDLSEGIVHLIENKSSKGIYNFCAPKPVQNSAMAKIIGKALHRPSFLKVPFFAISLMLGEFGRSIMGSQRANPERLLAEGFQFKYADFQSAITEVLSSSSK